MSLAHRIALECPSVTSTAVSLTDFPEYRDRYGLTHVPVTLLNGQFRIDGALPEDDVVNRVIAGYRHLSRIQPAE